VQKLHKISLNAQSIKKVEHDLMIRKYCNGKVNQELPVYKDIK
jgi:hypothetical protein